MPKSCSAGGVNTRSLSRIPNAANSPVDAVGAAGDMGRPADVPDMALDFDLFLLLLKKVDEDDEDDAGEFDVSIDCMKATSLRKSGRKGGMEAPIIAR